MAKRPKKPTKKVIKLFQNPQYKVGDIVNAIWLGERFKGPVLEIKPCRSDQTYSCYIVRHPNGSRYPCGLKVGEFESTQWGFVVYE